MRKKQETPDFQVVCDKRPDGKKRSLLGRAPTRQKARQMCRNRAAKHSGLRIIHPNGTEELWDG